MADLDEATPKATDDQQQQSSADQIFNQFCDSNNFQEILQLFNSLCDQVGLDPKQYEGFYSSLKNSLKSWKATSLYQLLDARASLPEYDGQKACAGKRVLVIGAGPVGLRGAIEVALLGAKVDLVEKRTEFSRNNSLHLWPFLITDLRNLGVKKFYGRFASGSIDHICIRILQAILLKICLLLGIKIHSGVTFGGIVEPKDAKTGWRVQTTPTATPMLSSDYDIILAADGKQNSVPGFKSKEFRAKLALAITVNYVNHNTQQENSVPEIGGVSFVYRQDFFNNLAKFHGIELENIVYYKDETHYFVMTVRKTSLLQKGVLKKDFNDPKELLSKTNIDRSNMEKFAIEATTFATDGGLGEVEFEKNHRGEKDVALFDFTSLFASENAARIIERKGNRLLLCLAGDSLIEPFWPTGSGCARGFLGAFDNAWMIKRFCTEAVSPMELIEQREAILYLLPQTTPRRLSSNHGGYTIDPKTRYLNLNELVPPGDVSHLYDSDNQNAVSMGKTRGSVPASSQDKPKPAIEQKTVAPTAEGRPKRSKSTEALFSEAQSASTSSSTTHRSGETSSKLSEPTTTDVKHFWQKRQSVKNEPKQTTSRELSQKTDKETNRTVSTKAPLSSETKSSSEAPSSIKKDSRTSSPVRTSRESSPRTNLKQKQQASQATSSKPPLPFSPSKVKTKREAKTPDRTEALSKSEQTQKKSVSSPKWSRFSLGSKSRSRSESPERKPNTKKDGKASKDQKSLQQHPLQITRSLQSLDRETEGVAEEQTQINVLDIIKKYDDKSESMAQSQTGGSKDKPSKDKPSAKDSKIKSDPKKGASSKPTKQDKTKEDKKSQKATKDTQSKGGFFSFFKSKKSYDVSSESPSSDKKKSKKSKKQAEVEQQALETPEEQLTVQGRIGRLKEIGLMTDGVDETDVVLVSVSPIEEAEKNEEKISGEEPSHNDQELVQSTQDDSDIGDTGGVVKSKLEATPPVEEEVKDETEDSAERVKKLAEVFMSKTEVPLSRHLSYTKKRSKEIDLSELLGQKTQKDSHPLWLARVIQGLNRCLERLRKENDIMVTKTALEIMNTIFSNVQSHPESDIYRRVRVSSERFFKKVWQFPDTKQFLARSGWVEIDDFIVLPMDTNVDNPKRVIDKHLNIVNQMLWSQQLELTDSPGVMRRMKTESKLRMRSASLMRRESYASRLVDDSMKRIEEDTLSMMAAKMREPSNNGGIKKSDEIRDDQGTVFDESTGDTKLSSLSEVCDDTKSTDQVDLPPLREEEQTMRAASAARNVWQQRAEKNKDSDAIKTERVYKLILETELYDLPHTKVIGRGDTQTRRPSPSSHIGQNQLSPKLPEVSEAEEIELEQETTTVLVSKEIPSDKNFPKSMSSQSFEVTDEHLRRLAPSNSSLKLTSSINQATVKEGDKLDRDETSTSGKSTNEKDLNMAELSKPVIGEATELSMVDSQSDRGSLGPSPTQEGNSVQATSSPSSSNGHSDQLRKLMMSTSPYPTTISPTSYSSSEEKSGKEKEIEVRPKPVTDAQHSSVHSIKNERLEYGMLTMEAAAQTRQKWIENEGAMLETTTKDKESTTL